jgi:hypothetical protein
LVVVPWISILNVTLIGAEAMTSNQRYLAEAQANATAFEKKQDPDLLRQAYLALENVDLAAESDSAVHKQMRIQLLYSWLQLLQLLDRFLDPNFDPEDVPQLLVQPPPTSKGVVYPPGADPKLIDEPKARAKYEKEIAENKAKTVHYNLQIKLQRLNERIPPLIETFIHTSYTPDIQDQAELKTAIDTLIKNPQRKKHLLKHLIHH